MSTPSQSPLDTTETAFARYRRASPWWWTVPLLGLGYLAWLLSAPERTREMRQFSIGFLGALNLAVAWAYWLASRRQELSGSVRKALLFFASGVAMVGLGAAYLLMETFLDPGYEALFSVADLFFLLSYPLGMLGLARLPRGERPAAGNWRILLDGLACVVGVGVPLWLGAIGPAFRESSGGDAVLVVLWPGISFLGLIAMNAALLTRAPSPSRGALWLLLAGLGVSWLADLVFALESSSLLIRNSPIQWTNLINAVALCLSFLAAWRFASDPDPLPTTTRPVAFSPVPMATMLMVATWLVLISQAQPSDPQLFHRILPGLILLFFVLLIREVLVLMDAARWMKAEQQRETYARVEAMVRHSTNVLMVVDARHVLQYASPPFATVLGRPAGECLGRPLLQLAHPDDVGRYTSFLDRLLLDPTAVTSLRWRIRHANGTYRHFETTGSNALDVAVVSGLVLNSRDVTDSFQLEEELRESHKLEAIGQLVGGIAHNFNNFLASTLLGLGLMREEKRLPNELVEMVSALERRAKQTAELIKQLQSFGQVQVLRRKRLDLDRLLTDLRPMLGQMVGAGVQVSYVSDARPHWVEADAALLNQVIFNLCANARDAMPRGGRLALELAQTDYPAAAGEGSRKAVCLSFQDTGRGMDESVRKHLFEPFFTTKDAGTGTGLGLAAVHGIIKQHGGSLDVESIPGQGTRFRVYLPLAGETAS